MNKLLEVRRQIYDQFHSRAGRSHFFKKANEDEFVAYYTAMYLLQDTGEALLAHRKANFSPEPMRSYIEIWGVMQALSIQQDAITELHKVIVGKKPKTGPAWSELRNLRHLTTGHPANRSQGVPGTQRTFMGRQGRTYESVEFEVWDAATQGRDHPNLDLGQLIDAYETEASGILSAVLATMKAKWP
jgi:hypothetical protein